MRGRRNLQALRKGDENRLKRNGINSRQRHPRLPSVSGHAGPPIVNQCLVAPFALHEKGSNTPLLANSAAAGVACRREWLSVSLRALQPAPTTGRLPLTKEAALELSSI